MLISARRSHRLWDDVMDTEIFLLGFMALKFLKYAAEELS